MNKKRKGFTLAETIITVIIIGILAAITVPILNKAKADKDTMIYRKGLYSFQRGLQKFMEGPEYEALLQEKREKGEKVIESDYLANFTKTEICQAIAAQLNTKGKIDCSLGSNPSYVTTDGIKFWGLTGSDKFRKPTEPGQKIYQILFIDSIEGPSQGEKNKRINNGGDANGLRIRLNYRGKTDAYGLYERSLIKDFTKMKN